ncbi:hypothetical protein [Shewanella sp. SR43-8]|uniref:hypothetical protein n=1 Tax=Shewanella sp. SR43-8 TaxID=2760938 RepID=UPI0015FEDDC4|nr:hypothetical protein [Shewanella sp. SR43-8]MBB1320614.1 hypothetical protein [Shewanella sp. SR43-8]
MGLPVTVYRSTDAGAPSIGTCKPSEIINILKKCLVSGYGSTAPLGWTIVAENTGTRNIMFSNNISGGGSGGCVNVKSHNGADTDGNGMWYQPCRSATSVTSMTNKGYICSTQCESYLGFDVWVVVGTAVGFFLIMGKSVNSSGYSTWVNSDERVVYCGDYNSGLSGDVSRMISFSDFYAAKNASNASTAPSWPELFGSNRMNPTSSQIFRIYDTDGAANKYAEYCVNCSFNSLGTESLDHADPVFDERIGEWWIQAYGFQIGYPSSAGYNDRIGVPRTTSGLSPYIRGRLYGLLEVELARWSTQTWPFYKDFNNQQHLALRSSTGGVSTFLNLVEW